MKKQGIKLPPPTPMEELREICSRATDGNIWGVGEGVGTRGKHEWYVYSSSKKVLKRLPKTYRGRTVVLFVCPCPRILKER